LLNRGAEFVFMCIPTKCWKTWSPEITTTLSAKNSSIPHCNGNSYYAFYINFISVNHINGLNFFFLVINIHLSFNQIPCLALKILVKMEEHAQTKATLSRVRVYQDTAETGVMERVRSLLWLIIFIVQDLYIKITMYFVQRKETNVCRQSFWKLF
jgi:hypothetical protein